MFVCILNADGAVLLHRNIATSPEDFLKVIAPFREDLVVGVECIFAWYWLADLSSREGIEFVLEKNRGTSYLLTKNRGEE